MSLREILALAQQPVEMQVEFGASLVKTLVNMILQLTSICETNDVDLHKNVHCFDLRSNEWHIAACQIYESLYRQDSQQRYDRGELRFDKKGKVIDPKKTSSVMAPIPTMSASFRPLLEMIDGYRRSVAAPLGSIVRKKHARYCDLDYIQNRLEKVESEVLAEIYKENNKSAVALDFIEGQGQNSGKESPSRLGYFRNRTDSPDKHSINVMDQSQLANYNDDGS